ncbi:hypothetical protein ES706_05835 [subsurface metagenome]
MNKIKEINPVARPIIRINLEYDAAFIFPTSGFKIYASFIFAI